MTGHFRRSVIPSFAKWLRPRRSCDLQRELKPCRRGTAIHLAHRASAKETTPLILDHTPQHPAATPVDDKQHRMQRCKDAVGSRRQPNGNSKCPLITNISKRKEIAVANVTMNLGEKLTFDLNDTSANTTFLTCPAGNTAPNNTIEATLNSVKQLEINNTNIIHTPSGRPQAVFGAADGGGGSDQYRLWLPNSAHKLLFFGGGSAPWNLNEFRVHANYSIFQGAVQVLGVGGSGNVLIDGDFGYNTARTKKQCHNPFVLRQAEHSWQFVR